MTEQEIIDFMKQSITELTQLDSNDLDTDTSWYELGMDSVELAGLISSVEESFHVAIGEEVLEDRHTMGELASYIYEAKKRDLQEI